MALLTSRFVFSGLSCFRLAFAILLLFLLPGRSLAHLVNGAVPTVGAVLGLWREGLLAGVPVHEAGEQSEGMQLAREAVVGAVRAEAGFAEGMRGSGFGGAGLNDGDEIVGGVVSPIAVLGQGVLDELAQFGNAGLHGGAEVHAGGAFAGVAEVACDLVG